jgi:hypothetical protein
VLRPWWVPPELCAPHTHSHTHAHTRTHTHAHTCALAPTHTHHHPLVPGALPPGARAWYCVRTCVRPAPASEPLARHAHVDVHWASQVLRDGTTAWVAEVRTREGQDATLCRPGVLLYRVDGFAPTGYGPVAVLDSGPDRGDLCPGLVGTHRLRDTRSVCLWAAAFPTACHCVLWGEAAAVFPVYSVHRACAVAATLASDVCLHAVASGV